MRSVNEFAFNFLRSNLLLDTKEDNQLISPLGIYLALCLLYNGAAGATRDDMARMLQLSGISTDELNAAAKALLEHLPALDKKVQLSIANSIWYSKTWPAPLAAFLDTNKNAYNSDIQLLDFSDTAPDGKINAWVAKQTKNKIPSLLARTNAADLLYLVNAVYFNASWADEFDPNITND